MTEKRIFDTTEYAMELFNDEMGTSFSMDSVIVRCFTPKTGLSIYKALCSEFFPLWEDRAVEDHGYFESFLGYAFYSDEHDGIMLRSDVEMPEEYLIAVILHELAHIFCSHNEIPGGLFYSRYCDVETENKIENGTMCAGYAIWREFIADMVMTTVNPFYQGHHLRESKPEIKKILKELFPTDPNAKLCLSVLLTHVMSSIEIISAESWEAAEQILRKSQLFPKEQFYEIFHLVWGNLRRGDFWTITPDFIMDLGSQYLLLMTGMMMASI